MPTTYLLPHQNTRLFPAELPNYGIMPESPFTVEIIQHGLMQA